MKRWDRKLTATLAEAYEEAADLVALYVERTGEPLQSLCKEIDPDNWNALRTRVQRAQSALKAAGEAGSERADRELQTQRRYERSTKQMLSEADDEQVRESALDARVRRARKRIAASEATSQPTRAQRGPRGQGARSPSLRRGASGTATGGIFDCARSPALGTTRVGTTHAGSCFVL